MRLWHKNLIPYLPKQQLLGQWRELNSIYTRRNTHLLINFIYSKISYDDLYRYSILVLKEMKKRKYMIKNLDNMCDFFGLFKDVIIEDIDIANIDINSIYPDKMNDRYLRQCYYNLEEKYDCGGIPEEEWERIIECKRFYNL